MIAAPGAGRSRLDAMLRARGRFAPDAPDPPWGVLLLFVVGAGLVYGGVMGAYGVRAVQMLYSALKVPLLLAASTLVCLPNFFVVNTLLGLRDDFAAAMRGVIAAQAAVSVTLAALGPLTAFAYVNDIEYESAKVLNGLMFAAAAVAGQALLQRHYRALIARNPRHRVARASWIVLYCFVAIQLAWGLRPFVGSPDLPPTFFREDAWTNAYVMLWRLLARTLG